MRRRPESSRSVVSERVAVSSRNVVFVASRASRLAACCSVGVRALCARVAALRLPRWRPGRAPRLGSRDRRGRGSRRCLLARRCARTGRAHRAVRRRRRGVLRRPRNLLCGPSLRDRALLRGARWRRGVRCARGLLRRCRLRGWCVLLAPGHRVSLERRVLHGSPLSGRRLRAPDGRVWARGRGVLCGQRVSLGLGLRGRALRALRWRWRALLRAPERVQRGAELPERSLRDARSELRGRGPAMLRGRSLHRRARVHLGHLRDAELRVRVPRLR